MATASFDTGIGADVVVNVGDEVSLDPVTGSITLPSGFVDALRDAGTLKIEGGGETMIVVAENDNTSSGAVLRGNPGAGRGADDPADRGHQLADGGTRPRNSEPRARRLLRHRRRAGGGGGPGRRALYLEDEGDATLDSFEVLRPATPTTTVTTTATATATRTGPVVETDRPSGGSGNTLFASAGAAAVLAGAGALLLGRRQGNHR